MPKKIKMKDKIIVDASRLGSPEPTGVEFYCRALLPRLAMKSDDIFFIAPKIVAGIDKSRQIVLPWFFRFWSQFRLGLFLLFYPPQVFFTPAYVIPLVFLLNKKTKKIVTIHDVFFVKNKSAYSFFSRFFLVFTTRQSVKYADTIITPTQATKKDLIKYFHCPSEKIIVTHFGVDYPMTDPLPKNQRKKQFFYIGRIESKKNIENLIKAFVQFHKKHPDHKLILAGKPGVGFENIEGSLGIHNFIEYVGYIDDAMKHNFFSKSLSLVFVSKDEGFGMPLLESFSFGLPVIASSIPVFYEVGSDACVFCDPSSASSIQSALSSIVEISDESYKELIENGQKRLSHFSWGACAQKTYNALRQNSQ